MIKASQKFDKKVSLESASFNFKKGGFGFGLLDSSNSTLSCSSKDKKFLLEVNSQPYSSVHIKWTVVKLLTVDNFYEPLDIEGTGGNLKDAFEKCETYYQEVISNPYHLEQLIRQKTQIEMEKDMIILAIEGQEHIAWLSSGFGEDVFPDRG